MKQLTKDEAVKMYDSEWWTLVSPWDAATFQVHQEHLCMPMKAFFSVIAETLCMTPDQASQALAFSGRVKERLEEKAPIKTPDDVFDIVRSAHHNGLVLYAKN